MRTIESSASIVFSYGKVKTFYFLSTLIPWLFWFAAGYISKLTPYQDKYFDIASGLAFIGLLAPVAISYILTRGALINKDQRSCSLSNK